MKGMSLVLIAALIMQSVYAEEKMPDYKDWNGKESYWPIYDITLDYRMRGSVIVGQLDDSISQYHAIYHSLLPHGQSETIDYYLTVEKHDNKKKIIKGTLTSAFGTELIGFKKEKIEFERKNKNMIITNGDKQIKELTVDSEIILGPLAMYIPVVEFWYKENRDNIPILLYDPAGVLTKETKEITLKKKENLQIEIPGETIKGNGYEGEGEVFLFDTDGKCTYYKSTIEPHVFIKADNPLKAKRQLKDYTKLGQRKPIDVLSDVYSAMASGDSELLTKSVNVKKISSDLNVEEDVLEEVLLSGIVPAKTGINPTNFMQALWLRKESTNGDKCEIAISEVGSSNGYSTSQMPNESNITFKFTFENINGVWVATNIKGLSNKNDFNDMLALYYNGMINQLGSQNKNEEALGYTEKATIFAKKEFGEKDFRVAVFLTSYAYLNKCFKKYDEAEKQYKDALNIFDFNNIYDDNRLRCLYNLHLLYKELGRNQEAEEAFSKWQVCKEKIETERKRENNVPLVFKKNKE